MKDGKHRAADIANGWTAKGKPCAQLADAACDGGFLAVLGEEDHRRAAKEAFAGRIHAAMGEEDVAGGEDFQLIDAGKDREVCWNFAERVKRALAGGEGHVHIKPAKSGKAAAVEGRRMI